MANSQCLVVVPTYAERHNLESLFLSIWETLPDAHLLIINDESGDGTPAFLKSRPEFGSTLHLIEREEKKGLGSAYTAGFEWALKRPYDFIIQMDADLSHHSSDLPRFLEILQNKAAVVLGSRYIDGVRVIDWPISRLLLSIGAALYVKIVTGMPFTDPTSGFKGFRKEALQMLDLKQISANGYGFQIEVTHWLWKHHCPIAELPIVFGGRKIGSSKMSSSIAREALGLVLMLRIRSLFEPIPKEKMWRPDDTVSFVER